MSGVQSPGNTARIGDPPVCLPLQALSTSQTPLPHLWKKQHPHPPNTLTFPAEPSTPSSELSSWLYRRAGSKVEGDLPMATDSPRQFLGSILSLWNWEGAHRNVQLCPLACSLPLH